MSGQPVEREQRVTPLELFFDLVVVFAFTQVTQLMAEDLTWQGLGHGLLGLAAIWWAWVGFAWLTNALEPEEGSVRAGMFGAMAAMLVVAFSVPGAFGANAVLPTQITSMSDQIVEWDGRALVDAIKAQARHEESNRWETIEFKLD